MSSIFRENTILQNVVDSVCMVCEHHLRNESELTSHIAKPIHKKNLDAAEYVEKYKDDKIRKVNKGYYCSFCGLLLSTATRAGLHLKEKQHIRNKAMQLLKRDGSHVVAYDSLLIDYDAWSGFSGDACAVCNIEVTNRNLHKSSFSHTLNLVQSCVEFGDAQQMYRKVDESLFHCITCNEIFSNQDLDSHFKEAEHSTRFTKCKDAFTNYKPEGKNVDQVSETVKSEVKAAPKVQKESNNKDNGFNNKQTKDITLENASTVTTQSKVHVDDKKDKNIKDEDTDDPVLFAKSNMLIYNAGSSNAYCRICDARLPASLSSMKEHVSGGVHRKLSAKASKDHPISSERPSTTKKQVITGNPYRKTPMKDFVEELMTIRHFNGHERIVNDKYCISQHSFLLITNNGQSLRCQACEMNLTPYQVVPHQDTVGHNQAMGEVFFITSLDHTEFVREVRPGIFHCGYCNFVVAPWENLQNHLKSREHKHEKEFFQKRKAIVEPELRQLRLRQFLEQTARRRMFNVPFDF